MSALPIEEEQGDLQPLLLTSMAIIFRLSTHHYRQPDRAAATVGRVFRQEQYFGAACRVRFCILNIF